MFPQLIAGPIVRYQDIARELNSRRETVEQFAFGVRLFIIGLGKKVLLANQALYGRKSPRFSLEIEVF